MQIPNKTLLYPKARNFIFLVLSVVVLVEVYLVGHLYHSFVDQQVLLAQASANGIKNNIESLIAEKQYQLKAFSIEEKNLLMDLLDFPADPENLNALNSKIDTRVSEFFSYMIASPDGTPLLEEKRTSVGPVCLAGIKAFSNNHQNHFQTVVTHGQSEADYHFDLMVKVASSKEIQGVFFISFRFDKMISLLANAELPNQSIILVQRQNPSLVELSALGVRKSRYGSFLPAPDTGSLLTSNDISGTGWKMLVVGNETYHYQHLAILVLLATLFFSVLFFISMVYLNRLKREETEKIKAEWQLEVTNNELESTVWTRTQELKREKDKAQVTLQSIGEGVITTDSSGVIESLNPYAEKIIGWSITEARGKSIEKMFLLIDEHTKEKIENITLISMKSKEIVKTNDGAQLRNRTGKLIPVEAVCSPIIDYEIDTLIGTVLIFSDITQRRQIIKSIEYDARHDSLTGIYNRRAFEGYFTRLMSRKDVQSQHHVLLYLDLDHFKNVNDLGGHAAGDVLLRELVLKIQNVLRNRDVFCRMGGDEFAIILENCTTQSASRVGGKIIQLVSVYELNWQGQSFSVGVSIGLTKIDFTKTEADIINKADQACYQAKLSGRNTLFIAK